MAIDYQPHHTTLPHITSDNWRDHAAAKRDLLAKLVPAEWQLPPGKYNKLDNVLGVPEDCGILSHVELQITEIDDATELLSRISDRQYTSVQVATAFCKRASIAQQLTNCLTEIFFDRALDSAKRLDEYLERHGKTVGPLHGLPISLKDQFDIAGIELTMGYAAYLGRISDEDSCLVSLLEDAGAVLYVRTNVPQTLMLGDTVNWVFGRTHNPHNVKLSPGGSSGGEGALLAMKGSILGVGTDIGGSVRIPSNFCGLHTIRPSTRRIPYGKATNSLLGQEAIMSVAGPMARSFNSVKLFIEVVCNANAGRYDSGALPFPYNSALYNQTTRLDKLCFGYMATDGHVHPSPAIHRALEMTVAALKKAGHEVIAFDHTQTNGCSPLAEKLYAADGGVDVDSILQPIDEPRIDPDLGVGRKEHEVSIHELHSLNREKEALQQSFLTQWLATAAVSPTGRPIDALLCAGGVTPACLPRHNKWDGYTMMWNLLDLPATILPVTTVDPKVDIYSEEYRPEPHRDLDSDVMANCRNELQIAVYVADGSWKGDPKISDGCPVAVQLVGRRWQEEQLIAVSERVEAAVKAAR